MPTPGEGCGSGRGNGGSLPLRSPCALLGTTISSYHHRPSSKPWPSASKEATPANGEEDCMVGLSANCLLLCKRQSRRIELAKAETASFRV